MGAADGAGNTVSGNREREKRLFILQPLLYIFSGQIAIKDRFVFLWKDIIFFVNMYFVILK